MVFLPQQRPAEPRANRRGGGFTLVEILVALAILAVALAAGMRAVGESADSATLLKQRTLALWVAQNRLAVAQIAAPWPPLGSREGEAVQAGARFLFREDVSGTPNPSFRRIDISVADPAVPDYALARITGYIGQPTQQ
jgi:general secretion pathway protein I